MPIALDSILDEYRAASRGRSGGLHAMAGFDFQVRCYLADFVDNLVTPSNLAEAGEQFVGTLEAFSDYTRIADTHLVCVQVKTTLDRRSLQKALVEFAEIATFFESKGEPLPAFEVVASTITPGLQEALSARRLGLARELLAEAGTSATWLSAESLLPPRSEADPWWRMIAAAYPVIDEPYEFARFALDQALSTRLGRPPATIRDAIADDFSKRRQPERRSARALTRADVEEAQIGPTVPTIGRRPNLKALRAGEYMPRRARTAEIVHEIRRLRAVQDDGRQLDPAILWIEGPSGSGKSVLLLQAMQSVVLELDLPVIWHGHDARPLATFLHDWSRREDTGEPSPVMFVDDLFDPQTRGAFDLHALLNDVALSERTEWPLLVTCGPPEFRAQFERACRGEAMTLVPLELGALTPHEADDLRDWYTDRSGRPHATERDSALPQLMVSVMAELQYGGVELFATRFVTRLESAGLSELLAIPLALNRLYIWPPAGWLPAADRRALAALSESGDLAPLEGPSTDEPLRLTHPHLSDAVYGEIRASAHPNDLADDLVVAFERSLGAYPDVAAEILSACVDWGPRMRRLPEDYLLRRLEEVWEAATEDLSFATPTEAIDLLATWILMSRRRPDVLDALASRCVARVVDLLTSAQGDQRAQLWIRAWRLGGPDASLACHGLALVIDSALTQAARISVWTELAFSHSVWSRWDELSGSRDEYETTMREVAHRFLTQRPGSNLAIRVWRALAASRLVDPRSQLASQLRHLCAEAFPTVDLPRKWAGLWFAQRSMTEPEARHDVDRRGVEWLESNVPANAWTWVWLEIAGSRTERPISDRLSAVGRSWLEVSFDDPRWPQVWQLLMHRNKDRLARAALSEVAFEWLLVPRDIPRGWVAAHLAFYADPAPSAVDEELMALILATIDEQLWHHRPPRTLTLCASKQNRPFFSGDQWAQIEARVRVWLLAHEDDPEAVPSWAPLVSTLSGSSDSEYLHILNRGVALLRPMDATGDSHFGFIFHTLVNALETVDVASGHEKFDLRQLMELGELWLANGGQADQSQWIEVYIFLDKRDPSAARRDLAVNYLFGKQVSCPGLREDAVTRSGGRILAGIAVHLARSYSSTTLPAALSSWLVEWMGRASEFGFRHQLVLASVLRDVPHGVPGWDALREALPSRAEEGLRESAAIEAAYGTGDTLDGTVVSLTRSKGGHNRAKRIGAVVKVGGPVGWVDLTDSYSVVRRTEFAVGSAIKVRVINFDTESFHLDLALAGPGAQGDVVTGKLVPSPVFGKRLRLQDGWLGHVHNTEYSWASHNRRPAAVGEQQAARVVGSKGAQKVLVLSVKRLSPGPDSCRAAHPPASRHVAELVVVCDEGYLFQFPDRVAAWVPRSAVPRRRRWTLKPRSRCLLEVLSWNDTFTWAECSILDPEQDQR